MERFERAKIHPRRELPPEELVDLRAIAIDRRSFVRLTGNLEREATRSARKLGPPNDETIAKRGGQ